MQLIWSELAKNDVIAIARGVAEYASPASAKRYLHEFSRIIDLLIEFPEIGREGIVSNTREVYPINGKYRIVYRLHDNQIEILTVVMSRKQYP